MENDFLCIAAQSSAFGIHQFRHTFAKRLLLSGASVENVSLLLGHKSIAVTQRHYNKFVAERQRNLELVVENSW